VIVFGIGVTLMLVVALAFLLWPLWRGNPSSGAAARNALNVAIFKDRMAELDQELADETLTPEQHAQARNELRRDLLINTESEDQAEAPATERTAGRWAVPVVAVLVPLLAVGLYLRLGTVQMVDEDALAVARHQQQSGGMDMEKVVKTLRQRLQSEPDNVEGWVLLGRSLVALKRYDEAAQALAKAHKLVGDVPALLAEYAEVLAMSKGGAMQGKPLELVQTALKKDPKNDHSLWLAGVAALQRKDYSAAIDYWNRLLAVVPKDSETARLVQTNIDRARSQMTGAGAVKLRVQLAPSLAGKVSPDDTVFIFARASADSRMPVAVVRQRAGDLPVTVTLDDSQSVMGGAKKLSDYKEVVVVARVSKSGSATPQTGDLEGSIQAAVGGKGVVTLSIDRVVP
jgi:cytochrome c-type biogenesis protein CcmH